MNDLFDRVEMPLLEMRCPECGSTQQMRTQNIHIKPYLTRCNACKKILLCELNIKTKPNNILFALTFTPVPKTKEVKA